MLYPVSLNYLIKIVFQHVKMIQRLHPYHLFSKPYYNSTSFCLSFIFQFFYGALLGSTSESSRPVAVSR